MTGSNFDVLVLGAGFGGLHALHALREKGLRVLCIEAGSDVGGTWYWNRYPGARCDVESLVYCYSCLPEIEAEWRWSEKYATQPEIMRYLQFVADRLGLRPDIRFDTRLKAARFDEESDSWDFECEDGTTFRARHFVSAAGPLSEPNFPDIPGQEDFRGQIIHSGRWPEEDPKLEGKRIGVIGTGSSGTQIIPVVAKQASQLTVFVRTPNYNVPARNAPLTDGDYEAWDKIREQRFAQLRTFEIIGNGDVFMDEALGRTRFESGHDYTPEQRLDVMERRWQNGGGIVGRAFSDTLTDREINDTVSNFLRAKVKEVVKDPRVAEILTPKTHPYGVKRVCVGTDFFETFNRDNVDVVDVRATPIERFTERGVIVDGREIELDVVIAACGFDALTGALSAIDLRGVDGRTMSQVWSDGPKTFLGIGVAGFPNLHMIGGPGSPSVLVNVVTNNEVQVEWIAGLIEYMEENGLTRIDVEPEAQSAWTRKVNDAIKGTLLEGAESWYLGANIPGKPRVILPYAGGIVAYREACNASRKAGYQGFAFSKVAETV